MKLRVALINVFPLTNKENGLERNTCQKKLSKNSGYIGRKDEDTTNYKEALNATTTEIKQFKRNYGQKLICDIKMTARVFIHMSGVNKTYETRLDH